MCDTEQCQQQNLPALPQSTGGQVVQQSQAEVEIVWGVVETQSPELLLVCEQKLQGHRSQQQEWQRLLC